MLQQCVKRRINYVWQELKYDTTLVPSCFVLCGQGEYTPKTYTEVNGVITRTAKGRKDTEEKFTVQISFLLPLGGTANILETEVPQRYDAFFYSYNYAVLQFTKLSN